MPAALLLIGLLISKNDENFQLLGGGGCSTLDTPRVGPPLDLKNHLFLVPVTPGRGPGPFCSPLIYCSHIEKSHMSAIYSSIILFVVDNDRISITWDAHTQSIIFDFLIMITKNFSGALQLTDLDDFIGPSQVF